MRLEMIGFRDNLSTPVALITGISGFLGQHLSATLRDRGFNVVGCVRNASQAEIVKGLLSGDITDKAFIADLVEEIQPNIVFHLAAYKSRTGGIEDFRHGIEDNIIGTLNLAEACIGKPYVQRFIAMGTCEEYGQSDVPFLEDMRESPVSGYSFSKTAVTHLLQTLYRTYQLPVVILRPSLAYGPGQATDMFLPALIQTLLNGEPFAMSEGQQTRDYVYIDDLIEAVILAATVPGVLGKVINISSGISVLLKDMALLVAQKIGANAAGLIEFGKKDYRHGEIMEYIASYGVAKTSLGWRPRTSLDEGLGLTIEHYRQLFQEAASN